MIFASGLIILALVVLGIAYFSSDQITFPHKQCGQGDPKTECNIEYEPVDFRASDGLILRGWYIPGTEKREPRKSIILCHGQMANKWDMLPLVPFLHEEGYSLLIFDFRAHGDSDGDICTIGFDEVKDLEAAVKCLQEQKRSEWIGVLGMSMGGSAAILAAANNAAIEAVVADCPFASLKETIYDICRRDRLPVLGGWLGIQMCRWRFGMKVEEVNPERVIEKLSPRPVLLIQSVHDSIVSIRQTQSLFEAAREPRQLWMVENAAHVQAFQVDQEQYMKKVLAVFAENETKNSGQVAV